MTASRWLRALGGGLVLGALVWHVGAGPFLDGLRVIDGRTILVALGAGLVSTLCSAWRWRATAAGLGVALPWWPSVAAYYRSQFLNATLPLGVAGDLQRALRHGRSIGDLRLAARAVVLERAGSLMTQVTLSAILLLVLPSPMPRPLGAGIVAVALVLAVAVSRSGPFAGTGLAVVVVSSSVALVGHLTVFVAAARAAGSSAPLGSLLAPTLLALLAMAVPLSLAGWGPREGVAAWAFGVVGLGTATGVTAAVAYGVASLIACLPGAVLLAADWWPATRAAPRMPRPRAGSDAPTVSPVAIVGQAGGHE